MFDMKKGRKLVVAFLLFITVETLIYTIYSGKEPDLSSDPLPLSDYILLSEPKVCMPQIFKNFTKNLNRVKRYPIGDSGPYLQALGLSSVTQNASTDLPVIVTAASSNHFSEVKALLKHLEDAVFPFTGRLTVVLFDIGLTKGHLLQLKGICNCEVRQFPFSSYPKHVAALWGFAWKPIIIQMMLVKYGFVMWMDSSVAITDGTTLAYDFRTAKTHGISISWSGEANPSFLAGQTHTQTFKLLGEKPCTFRKQKEFYATFMILYRTKFVEEAIMRPWISCALTSGCMVMNIPHYTHCYKNNVYAECHRFDQSVLSIILNRLFHDRRKDIELSVPWIKCGSINSISYLPTFMNDYLYEKSKNAECKGIR